MRHLLLLLATLPGTALAGWDFCPAGSATPCSETNQACGPRKQGGPQFHFRDPTCGMNDPNGPFFDARHGLYHLFYQDHIGRAAPASAGFEGPSWGHGVSPDLVRWTHLPVALWNGEAAFDNHALFTGSATLVSSATRGTTPVLVFPGVCDLYPPSGDVPGCKYGYAFGSATPSNASDPFLVQWSKSAGPIVNNTFDDPSTAWETADGGELRWIANCGDGTVGDCGPDPNRSLAPLYAATTTTVSDENPFATSRVVGFTNLAAGECPSLYPLPPLANGTQPTANMPSHVHKWGCEPYTDCAEVGWWREGKAKGETVGTWTGLNGNGQSGNGYQAMDRGFSYASKDVAGAPGGQRISISWARLYPSQQGQQVNGDVQTVARQVTYHPTLRQLLFYPLPALASLRGRVLGSVTGRQVTPDKKLTLGPFADGNQSDVLVRMRVPASPTTVYVSVPTAEVRIEFYIDFPGTTAAAAAAATSEGEGEGAPWSEAEVGLLTADPYVSFKDSLRLLPGEDVVELRLLLDHTIAEVYWAGGRVVMTAPAPLTESTSVVVSTDTAGATLEVETADVWHVNSAWVGKEEVLSRRRFEGGGGGGGGGG